MRSGLVRRATTLSVLLLSVVAPAQLHAQSLDGVGAVPTGLLLRKLDGVKRVLMIGAHPDDEDTSLLTTLGRTYGVETAYLALTRGDGGQNLIGPELWEGLGVIRTGELEAARRRDGGRQFFTRAFDFGFSKTAEEALRFWPRDELLRDVVWVVRTFRPHVIVTVFSGTPRDGHGQHQAAGIMAREVFQAAGDPTRYPEQLQRGVEAWTPLKLYQAAWRNPEDATVRLDAGRLDPLLGRSAFQLAMESRSQHRSQDMGSQQPLGPRAIGVIEVESRVGDGGDGLFSGVDTTLVGLTAALPTDVAAATADHLGRYREALDRARSAFGLDPEGTAAALLEALDHLEGARAAAGGAADRELRTVLETKMDLARQAYMAAAGIVVDVRAEDALVTPGQPLRVTVQLWNGSDAPLSRVRADLVAPPGWAVEEVASEVGAGPGVVEPGSLSEWVYEVQVPKDASPSRLYYLERERDGEFYRWPDEPSVWGLPRQPALAFGSVGFAAGSREIAARSPWRYVGVDQAFGEFTKPVLVTPAVSAKVSPAGMVWPQGGTGARTLTVSLRGEDRAGLTGEVSLEATPDWVVTPRSHAFDLAGEGSERSVTFTIEPRNGLTPGEHVFRALVRTGDGREYRETVSVIDYEHVTRTLLFTAAEARVTVVPVRIADNLRVGYVMGTGDDGPEAIRQIGADVRLLGPEEVRDGAFDDVDVLVLGVRAYETRDDLRAANEQVLDFARAGGTVVVQYNQYQYARGNFAPYPLDIGRPADRVSDQTAPVRLLDPDAPLFTSPNRITAADFEGWVQERGLYFLGQWDDRYVPLLEMNDPGEEPKHGSLLVAPVGEGLYVYAALSFFRQWSSRVPGAYRLFANLLSLRAEEWRRSRP